MSGKVLKISTGCIKGEEKITALNSKKFYSFKGIPYAEPPTGEKRFKDPVPCKPWQGVRDATKHGNICPQFHEFLKKIVGDEDCLFINVYTPKIPDEKSCDAPLLPVMVYIHGGGFTFGSGNDDLYGPDYIIEHNVVLVTLNYRVGVFGFFSLGNSDAPGNAGLKDQSLALKWVSENIKYFGGDCNNVTLFGESAGAASVQYHTLSPLSAGLFHRVILQSGSALNPWAFFENPVPRAFNLGEVLGNKTTDACNLVKFLRDQPSETLVANQGKVLSSFEKKKLTFPFVPCKEVVGTGDNFITETPETLLKSGKFSKVPYIIGMNDKEGLINLKEETDLKVKLQKISVDPERFIPHDMLNSSNPIDDIFKRVKHFYLGNSSLAEETLDQYVDLWTDIEFSIGINKSVKYLLSKPDVPVYLYLFTFEGQLGYLKAFIKNIVNNVPKGVCHADDLGYVFHNSMVTKELPVPKDSPEVTVIEYFSTFWTNFAKNSDPNDKKYNCEWKKTSVENPQYLDIGEVLKIICTSFVPERLKFWENLYESQKLTHKL